MSSAAEIPVERARLLSLAYRMLGSRADAEDAVQEAFVRWQSQDRRQIQSPGAFLATVTTRICIDRLRSAQVQRETYPGACWLPEPWIDTADWPEQRAELAESLSLAFLHLLESVSPTERAAFLLHDVFGYGFREIAAILELEEANCRQLAARAREHVRSRRPRFEVDPQRRDELATAFMTACQRGDLEGLVQMLASDAAVYTDSGGKAVAAQVVLRGALKIGRFLLGVMKKAAPGTVYTPTTINGQPGILVLSGGRVDSAMMLDIGAHSIQGIYAVRNPDKLQHVARKG
ncbi:MAG: RNA polymerase sigma-70 factor [Pirellulales bacterium]|nr:RNA polymerase sigma-70 factor [Pirellulales bacterium]